MAPKMESGTAHDWPAPTHPGEDLGHVSVFQTTNQHLIRCWFTRIPLIADMLHGIKEYIPTFARTKSPSYVGRYTMEHMGWVI